MIKINSYIHKSFPEKRPYSYSSLNISFQTDLASIYGFEVDESLLSSGRNNSFSYMGSSLIDHLSNMGNRIDDVDLVVLVYCIPDINLSTSSVNYFIDKYALDATGFAVSGVDTYAPFAAMKIIKELFNTKKCKKAIFLILDQSTLSYPVTRYEEIEDTGIAFLVESHGTSPCLELDEWGYDIIPNLRGWLDKITQKQKKNVFIISSNLEEIYEEMPSNSTFISSPNQLCTSLFAKLLNLISEDKVQGNSSIYLLDGNLVRNEMYYLKFNIYGGKM